MDNVVVSLITLLVCLLISLAIWFKINYGRKSKVVERKDLPKELISRGKMIKDCIAPSQKLTTISQQTAGCSKSLMERVVERKDLPNELISRGKMTKDCLAPSQKLTTISQQTAGCSKSLMERDENKMDRHTKTTLISEYEYRRRLAHMSKDENKMDRHTKTTLISEYEHRRRLAHMNKDSKNWDQRRARKVTVSRDEDECYIPQLSQRDGECAMGEKQLEAYSRDVEVHTIQPSVPEQEVYPTVWLPPPPPDPPNPP